MIKRAPFLSSRAAFKNPLRLCDILQRQYNGGARERAFQGQLGRHIVDQIVVVFFPVVFLGRGYQ